MSGSKWWKQWQCTIDSCISEQDLSVWIPHHLFFTFTFFLISVFSAIFNLRLSLHPQLYSCHLMIEHWRMENCYLVNSLQVILGRFEEMLRHLIWVDRKSHRLSFLLALLPFLHFLKQPQLNFRILDFINNFHHF